MNIRWCNMTPKIWLKKFEALIFAENGTSSLKPAISGTSREQIQKKVGFKFFVSYMISWGHRNTFKSFCSQICHNHILLYFIVSNDVDFSPYFCWWQLFFYLVDEASYSYSRSITCLLVVTWCKVIVLNSHVITYNV